MIIYSKTKYIFKPIVISLLIALVFLLVNPINVQAEGSDDHGNDFASATLILDGAETTGELESIGDYDYFTFVPDFSGMYTLETTGTTETYCTLYDSEQSALADDYGSGIEGNAYIVYNLAAGQKYYLKIGAGSYNDTGQYVLDLTQVGDDHGNDIASATTIEVGAEGAGEITYTQDVDYFKFTAPASGAYIIESTGSTDTEGYLYNSSVGNVLYSNSDISENDKNFRMTITLEANKTYYIGVSHQNNYDQDNPGIGAYGLRVIGGSDDHGNDFASATLIQDGTETAGDLESIGDSDYFKFVPDVNGMYIFETTGTTDINGTLYDSEQSALANDYGSGIEGNAYIVYNLVAGETYYLIVGAGYFYNYTGMNNYVLKVTQVGDDHGNDIASATVIEVGAVGAGEITYTQDVDYFKFTTTVNGAYIIESTGITDTYGIMYDSNANYIDDNHDISENDQNFRMTITLEANKTYYIEVSHQSNYDQDNPGTGTFGIRVLGGSDDHGNDFASATLIQDGTETAGDLESIGDSDYFKFVPDVNGIYTFEITGTTDTSGALYDSEQSELANDYSSGIEGNTYIIYNLAAGQTYYLKISGYGGEIGQYVLKVNQLVDDHGNDIASATTIEVGEDGAGEISYTQDVDYFKFTAKVSGVHVIETNGITDTNGTLYNSEQSELAEDYHNGIEGNTYIVHNLVAGQTYYLKVSADYYHYAGMSNYTLKVNQVGDDHGNDIASATAIEVGVDGAGEITYTQDVDFFKFTTTLSGAYIIESTGSTDTYGVLNNSNDGYVGSNSDISESDKNFRMTITLEANKTYYIGVSHQNNYDQDNPGTGAYGLKVLGGSDDYGNDFASATLIQEGAETAAALESIGDCDYFKFVPDVNGMYTFETTGTTDTNGTLYDSEQSVLAIDYGSGIEGNTYIVYNLAAGETYYLKINAWSYYVTGQYVMNVTQVVDDHGNDNAGATAIELGADGAGEITYTQDVDYFKFTTTVSGTYIIESTGSTDTYAVLYNNNEGYVDSNSDISENDKNFRMTITLEANMIYYIGVSHQNNYDQDNPGTGAYGLRVIGGSDDHGNDFASATLIQEGTETTGDLESIGDNDYFKFVPDVNGMYTIETTGTTDTFGTLYGSEQSELAYDYGSGIDNNTYIVYNLAAGQTYYVKICDDYYHYAGINNYVLKVNQVGDDHGNDIAGATTIYEGEDGTGEITYTQDVDYFEFTATVSGAYIIESTGSIDTHGIVYDSSEYYIDENYDISEVDKNFRMTITLEANETYYIGISHQENSDQDNIGWGSYMIRISQATLNDDYGNSFATATEVPLGIELQGIIETVNDIDYVKFIPTVTGSYTMETIGSSDTYGYLYDSTEAEEAYDDSSGENDNFRIVHTLTSGQLYYLSINNASSVCGTYKLRIYLGTDDYSNEITSAAYINIGANVSGTINYGGDLDFFKFLPTASGIYAIKSSGSTDTSGNLYDNIGNLIEYSDNASDTDTNFNLTENLTDGRTYYLKVSHSNIATGTGAYIINVVSADNPIVDDYGNSFDTATQINSGTDTAGIINYPSDIDFLKFIPQSTGIYTIESKGTLDTRGYLYNSIQEVIAVNDDNGIGTNFYMPVQLTANQTYYLKVYNKDSAGTGAYVVNINEATDDHGNDFASATTLQAEEETTGEVNYPCDVDVFVFVPPISGSYVIGSKGNTDTQGKLYNSSGSLLYANDNISTVNDNFRFLASLTAAETYYLKVWHQNNSDKDTAGVGAYTVSAYRDDEAPSIPEELHTVVSDTTVTLSWNQSVDNYALAGYRIYRNGNQIANSVETTYTDSGLSRNTTYIYTVKAFDEAGNNSAASQEKTVNIELKPAPSGLNLTASLSDIIITWAEDVETNIAYYQIYRSVSDETNYVIYATNITTLGYQDSNVELGKTYYYKVASVDSAGEISALSQSLSVSIQSVDLEKPIIQSIYPAMDSTMPANPIVSVWATDNYKLAQILVEYQKNGESNWTILGTKAVDINSNVAIFTWNTTGLSSGSYQLRATAVDSAGNASNPSTNTYSLDVSAPAIPVLTGTPGGWNNSLSWTSANESDLAGFRLYRSTSADGSYKMIAQLSKIEPTSYLDAPLNPANTYYYVVEAIDGYNNSSRSAEVAVMPLANDPYAPIAAGGDDQKTIINTEVAFDGLNSSDNDSIASYSWNFGDGATSSLMQPTHTYAAIGQYTVTLTVTDPSGNTDTDTVNVTVIEAMQTGTLRVIVLDKDTGAALDNASVMIQFPDGTTQSFTSNNLGIATTAVTAGDYKIYAIKMDYKPASISAQITVGQETTVTINLDSGKLVVGELNVTRLSLDEIVAAGIDTSAPENQFVYKFEVHLAFNNVPLPYADTFYVNSWGIFLGTIQPIVIPTSIGGTAYSTYIAYPVAIPYINHPEIAPTIAYLVIPGEARWLKEFFEVGLTLQNSADAEFVIENSQATLCLPDGLSLAPIKEGQSLTVDLGTIAGQESRELKWIIRGDQKGEYNLQANFTGSLQPFDDLVSATFSHSNPIKVWGSDALKMHVDAQERANRGFPYHVRFGLENVSDGPVYNVSIELKEETKKNYIYAPNQKLVKSVSELPAGQTIWADYWLIPLISGQLDLSQSFVVNTGDAETNVNSVITSRSDPENYPETAPALQQQINNDGTVTLIWEPVSEATGYNIYNVRNDLNMSTFPGDFVCYVGKDDTSVTSTETSETQCYIITTLTETNGQVTESLRHSADIYSLLSIVSIDPQRGEEIVPLNKEVTITFNKNIVQSGDKGSGGIYCIFEGGYTRIDSVISIEGNKLIIKPVELLKNQKYSVELPLGYVKGESGDGLNESAGIIGSVNNLNRYITYDFYTGTLFSYPDSQGTGNYKTFYDYSDDYFASTPYFYDHDLATMSLCLAMSAFGKYGAIDYTTSNEGDYRKTSDNVNELLTDIGFGEFHTNPGFENKPGTDSIGVAIAKKEVNLNNDTCTLLAVAIRGGGYEREWASNFTIGNDSLHQGFGEARDQVIDYLNEYIVKYNVSGDVKIWITGFSRAAATANLVAGALDDGSKILSNVVSYSNNDIYAYCFETPAGLRTNEGLDPIYNNIFSIVNPSDLVPKVAPAVWGYRRYGITKYLPTAENHASNGTDYATLVTKMKWTYGTLSDLKYTDYIVDGFSMKYFSLANMKVFDDPNNKMSQSLFLDTFINILTKEQFGSPADYVANYQSDIRKVVETSYILDSAQISWIESRINTLILDHFNEIAFWLLQPDILKYNNIKSIVAECVSQAFVESGITLFSQEEIEELTDKIVIILIKLPVSIIAHPNYYATLTQTSNINRIIEAHYPELCLAWMNTIDPSDLTTGAYRAVYINCPVDVNVYDLNNHIVASIIDDVPQDIPNSSIISSIDENGQKIIYLPANAAYSIEVIATDNGSMTYSVNEFSPDAGEATRVLNYYDVKISKGDILSGQIDNLDDTPEAEYILTGNDGKEIAVSDNLTGEEIKDYMVNIEVQGSGTVTGNGLRTKGEFAKVTATPTENSQFLGWFINDGIVSTDMEYRFCVLSDVKIVAKFTLENEQIIKDFITRFYKLCLDRDPDPNGLDFWVNILMSGENTGAQLSQGFIFSNEFVAKHLSNTDFVAVMYRVFFNREPDGVGQTYWENQLVAGNRYQALIGFIESEEFGILCDDYSITRGDTQSLKVNAFVTRFYNLCLNREPDAVGLAFWVNPLIAGENTGANVADGFIFSSEFVGRNLSNSDFIVVMYRAFFNREPDGGGQTYWLGMLGSGTSRLNVLKGFVSSAEFVEICSDYNIQVGVI